MINENSLTLLSKGYFQNNESSWNDIAKRVSNAIAKAEENEGQEKYAKVFYRAISNLDFIPSTPCLINAGTESQQLSSCFIIDLKDNIESIYEVKSEMAKIFQKNGGVGLNISVLRPMGANVETSKGKSCGTIGFMEEFDLTADVVTRNNLRKGAIKIDLSDFHPDIIEFIKCKDDTTKFTRINISVALSNKFMNAVINNEDWNLEFPDYTQNKDVYNAEWNGDIDDWKEKGYATKIYQTIKAKDLYYLIMEHAWKTGEPGVSFLDNMNKDNPNPSLGKTNKSNPCAEFTSIPYNSCNLGSINLSHMVTENSINYEKLKTTVYTAVRFLDDMITMNQLPLDKITSVTKYVRSIGLGTMGFADMLYKLRIPYGSSNCHELIDELYGFIKKNAIEASKELAAEKGCYEGWKNSIWESSGIEIRNSNLLSIAPNGSIAFIANTSGGLEPNFALCYSRRMNDGTLFYVTNPILEEVLKNEGIYSEEILQKIINNNGSCNGIKEIPIDIQKVFVVASDLSPEQHLDVLANIQKYVDLSCSKTINLSNDSKIKDIEDIYINAWSKGVKGVTVYRDGSREMQTLSVKRDEDNIKSREHNGFDYIEPVSKDELGETYGTNVKRKVACGKLYINVCRDTDGNLVEIFINTGKGGICQSNTNAISRLVSMSLRSGIKAEEIIDQLKGIVCPACRATSKSETLSGLSCADVIAKTLLDEYNKDEIVIKKAKKKALSRKKQTKPIEKQPEKAKCQECNGELKFEGGCVVCTECGWSRCS